MLKAFIFLISSCEVVFNGFKNDQRHNGITNLVGPRNNPHFDNYVSPHYSRSAFYLISLPVLFEGPCGDWTLTQRVPYPGPFCLLTCEGGGSCILCLLVLTCLYWSWPFSVDFSWCFEKQLLSWSSSLQFFLFYAFYYEIFCTWLILIMLMQFLCYVNFLCNI